MGDGDGDLHVGDEVFEGELGGFVEDLSAAGVAVLIADLFESLMMTRRSFFSEARMDSSSAMLSRTALNSFRSSSIDNWVRR